MADQALNAPTEEPGSSPQRVVLHLSWRSLAMVATALLLAWAAFKLWPLALLLFLGVLVAVTLHPISLAMRRHGVPHWLAVTIIGTAVAAAVGGLFVVAIPPLINETAALVKRLPDLREQMMAAIPPGVAQDTAAKVFDGESLPDAGALVGNAAAAGTWLLSGLLQIGVVLTLAVYLLADGERAWKWLLPYLPKKHRLKLHRTASEMSEVIYAYVSGQVLTSLLCTAFTFIVLLWLDVPAALILAILAGVLDILPIVGFFISIVPAVILALTVSPSTAVMVLALYLLYNAVENYIIIPKIYGSRMRLSTLTVLLALFAGGILAGVPGAIAILPLVASYPIIERIWLGERLGLEVLEKHEQMANEAAPPDATK